MVQVDSQMKPFKIHKSLDHNANFIQVQESGATVGICVSKLDNGG